MTLTKYYEKLRADTLWETSKLMYWFDKYFLFRLAITLIPIWFINYCFGRFAVLWYFLGFSALLIIYSFVVQNIIDKKLPSAEESLETYKKLYLND